MTTTIRREADCRLDWIKKQINTLTLAGLSRFQRQSGLCAFGYSDFLVQSVAAEELRVLPTAVHPLRRPRPPIGPPHNHDFKYIPLLAVSDVVHQEL
jgi:hypothetical protein